jgi:hypothetical protein
MPFESTDQEEDGFRCVTRWEDSTLHCPCGSEFTWEGIDPRLDAWKAEHRPHARPER